MAPMYSCTTEQDLTQSHITTMCRQTLSLLGDAKSPLGGAGGSGHDFCMWGSIYVPNVHFMRMVLKLGRSCGQCLRT